MREVLFSKANFRPNACVAEINNLTDSCCDLRENLSGKTKELGSDSFIGVVILNVYYPRTVVSLNLELYNFS